MTDDRVRPEKLYLASPTELGIDWSDGQRRMYSIAELRRDCPCAGCASERQPDVEHVDRPDPDANLGLRDMAPVGNYAYKIVFSDGHATGIFPLQLLRELGREVGGGGS